MSRFTAVLYPALLGVFLSGCGNEGDDKGKRKDGAGSSGTDALRDREWGHFAAPDIVGTDTKGDPFSIKAHRGKVVMLDFWATWCGPCVAMIPHEKMLAERLSLAKKPFVILGISADHQLSDLTTFERDRNIQWRNLLAGPKTIPDAYQVEALPTIVLIDHEGMVRYRFVGGGSATAKEVEAAVELLLTKAEKK